MTDEDRKQLERLLANHPTPAGTEKAQTFQARMKAVLDPIAEKLLGIRPEHGDTIYTQHPIMAGVLREALREAYLAGGSEFAATMIELTLK